MLLETGRPGCHGKGPDPATHLIPFVITINDVDDNPRIAVTNVVYA